MSMNMNSMYGSGYGMGSGMSGMQGMYGSMYGGSGNMMTSFKQQYGCDNCYQNGPVFYKYNIPVNELPNEVVHPSWIKSVMSKLFGM